MARDQEINYFLQKNGWNSVHRVPLADDASFRRYERLLNGKNSAVLMDAPPDAEKVEPFVRIAKHLRDFGLSSPEVLAVDKANGFSQKILSCASWKKHCPRCPQW